VACGAPWRSMSKVNGITMGDSHMQACITGSISTVQKYSTDPGSDGVMSPVLLQIAGRNGTFGSWAPEDGMKGSGS